MNWKRKWKWLKLKSLRFFYEVGEEMYEVYKMGWKPY